MAIEQDNTWTTRSTIYNLSTGYPFITTSNQDSNWSTFLKSNGVVSASGYIYQYDVRFNNPGKQKFRHAADGTAYFYIDGVYQFQLGPDGGSTVSTTAENFVADRVYRLEIVASNTDRGYTAVAMDWEDAVYDPVTITSFEYSDYLQDFGDSTTPTSLATLNWVISDARKVIIDNNVGVVTGGTETVNTYLKSDAVYNSPAVKTYTLTAYGYAFNDIQTASVDVEIRNDNSFTFFQRGVDQETEIPNFLDEITEDPIIFDCGTIEGIDMPIDITSVNADFVVGLTNEDGGFSTSITAEAGDKLWIKFNIPDYSLDEFGEQNIKEYVIDIGTQRKTFTVGKKAPDFTLNFDAPNVDTTLPFPKIDTTSDVPEEYTVTTITSSETGTLELVNPYGTQIRTHVAEWSDGHVPGIVEVKVIEDGSTAAEIAALPWKEPNDFYDNIGGDRRLLKEMDLDSIERRSGSIYNLTDPEQIKIRLSNGTLVAYNVKQ